MPILEAQMSPMIHSVFHTVQASMPPFLHLLSTLEGEWTDSLWAWLHNGNCHYCNPQAELMAETPRPGWLEQGGVRPRSGVTYKHAILRILGDAGPQMSCFHGDRSRMLGAPWACEL